MPVTDQVSVRKQYYTTGNITRSNLLPSPPAPLIRDRHPSKETSKVFRQQLHEQNMEKVLMARARRLVRGMFSTTVLISTNKDKNNNINRLVPQPLLPTRK